MADIGYPVFEGGMTLTKDDLNMLRDFLDVQDSVLGRLIGFGIACGLEGGVDTRRGTDTILEIVGRFEGSARDEGGGVLVIGPGLAIDQHGRGLVLDKPVKVTADSAARATFSFVDPALGGITPVLVFREVDEAAPECDDDSCEPHAPLRIRSARVVLAQGRLVTSRDTFAAEPLLRQPPLTVSADGQVRGDLAKLRKAVLDRLDAAGVTLSAHSRSVLAGLAADGLPAVRVYRASYLNQVLFAAIELLRCRALHRTTCLDDEATPGVALGWLTAKGGWDCRYRHSFTPTDGLAMALLGGACGDPCGLLLARLETVIASYSEPSAPKPTEPPKQPPKGSDFDVCPPYGRYGYLEFDKCRVVAPPDYIDPDWFKERIPEIDEPWKWMPDPPDYYRRDPIDFFKTGTIELNPAFGAEAERTKDVLIQLLGEHVKDPDVRVVTLDEAVAMDGYSPQTNVALGDTVVLVTDELGKIVTTGRVSAQHMVRTVVPTATSARADAAAALETVTSMTAGIEDTIADRVGGVRAELDSLLDLQAESFRTELASRLDLQAESFRTELASRLDLQAESFRTELASLAEMPGQFEDLKGQVTTRLEETTTSLRGELLTVTSQVNQRIDSVVLNVGKTGPQTYTAPAPSVEVGKEELVTVIGSLREAVTAAATTRQLPGVEEKLAAGEEALRAIETSDAPVVMTREQGTALVGVFKSLTDAAAGAGAPPAQIEALRLDLSALETRYR